ncbi:MAG: LysR family transcriptional regulator [Nitrospirae bacterium]|nr:MAG: LysR family transcriptional regulator [Nitrospirota bacterium]
MELRQLRYFLAVAQHKNFTRAAQAIHLSQPSLSIQIQALEEELGAPLFHRLGRQVALTEAGMVLYDYARRALRDLDQAKDAIREINGAERGQLTIGVLSTVNTYLIPPVVARFRHQFPHLTIHIYAQPSRAIEQDLLDNQLDLGLCLLPTSSPRLITKRLFNETLCLVGPPTARPLGTRAKMSTLANLPLVLMPTDYCLRSMIETSCAHVGIRPNVSIEMTAPEGILEVVARGAGWTILPELYVRHANKGMSLQVVRLYDPVPRHAVGFASLAHRYLGPSAHAFMALCHTALEDIQANRDFPAAESCAS